MNTNKLSFKQKIKNAAIEVKETIDYFLLRHPKKVLTIVVVLILVGNIVKVAITGDRWDAVRGIKNLALDLILGSVVYYAMRLHSREEQERHAREKRGTVDMTKLQMAGVMANYIDLCEHVDRQAALVWGNQLPESLNLERVIYNHDYQWLQCSVRGIRVICDLSTLEGKLSYHNNNGHVELKFDLNQPVPAKRVSGDMNDYLKTFRVWRERQAA